ncbi:MAG: MoaD/ThiS family protein [Planctomycetaceae bacterium]|nr:MoaD/ThiS family protein [Planctomycetaceae bacterium]
MIWTVHLFAGARDAAGAATLEVELPEGATVADLRRALQAAAPGLTRLRHSLWIAVNGDYAADADLLPEGAEIACFPPVSGG